MCTVLLRFAPAARWPVLLAAVRDEFADRAWDPPGAHWPGTAAHLLGGRDRVSGGTWLAVDPVRPAVAAVLNGVLLPPPPDGVRRTRGSLPLAALTGRPVPADVDRYDGFHLLLASTERVRMWTWDGQRLRHQALTAGDHVIVNRGADAPDDPLVPHFSPLLAALPDLALDPDRPAPAGVGTGAAWPGWVDLLAGAGLDPADPRALIVTHRAGDRTYASTSATLVGLAPTAVRYDFTANPGPAACWAPVPVPARNRAR